MFHEAEQKKNTQNSNREAAHQIHSIQNCSWLCLKLDWFMYVVVVTMLSHLTRFLCHLLPMHFRHICRMAFRFHRILLVQTFSTVSSEMEKRDVIYNKNDI